MKAAVQAVRAVINLLTILVSLSPASAAPFLHGGFETGALAPWLQDRDYSDGAGEDWAVTSAAAHSGAFCAAAVGDKELRLTFVPIKTAKVTQVSLWLRHPTLADAPAAIDFFYSDGTSTRSVIFTSSLDWEFFDVTRGLAGDKQFVGFSIFGFGSTDGPGRIFIDDVVILPEVEPLYRIQIRGAGAQQAVLTWSTNAVGYLLETAESIPTATWTTITNAPVAIGDQFALTLETTGRHQIFRLHKQ